MRVSATSHVTRGVLLVKLSNVQLITQRSQHHFYISSDNLLIDFTVYTRCLGLENRKGTLRPGADADFVVLDRRGTVLSTWVKGREAWTKSA